MSAATNTLNEFEWGTHSILAEAGQVLGAVFPRSSIAIAYFKIHTRLQKLVANFEAINALFHDPACISELEAAGDVELAKLVAIMAQASPKTARTIRAVRTLPGRDWNRLNRAPLARLDLLVVEFDAHLKALQAARAGLLLLTRHDLDAFIHALEQPPEPNEALRRLLARH